MWAKGLLCKGQPILRFFFFWQQSYCVSHTLVQNIVYLSKNVDFFGNRMELVKFVSRGWTVIARYIEQTLKVTE